MKQELQERVSAHDFSRHYVAIIYLGDTSASSTYVRMKQKFAHDIGLSLKIIGQDGEVQSQEDLLRLVHKISHDPLCL